VADAGVYGSGSALEPSCAPRRGPVLSAGEAFVAGWQDPAGGEHVPQVVSGPLTWVSVQRLVGCGEAPGGDVGEQDGTRSAAEPVQRAARLARGRERFEHARQVRRDVTEPCGQQLACPAAQAAPITAAFLVELVLESAVAAGVGDWDPGAVCAGVSARPGRSD
jgi:hypothetical protein